MVVLQPKGQVVGSYEGRVKKIFVGGLSYNTTESDVRQYFSQYGEVYIHINSQLFKSPIKTSGAIIGAMFSRCWRSF